jgi:DNA (cytosine-5)-methyltransferase 1
MASVVDLFCGIGGLTHGFVKEGFNVVAGIDVDRSCKYAFEYNNKARFICKDIGKVTADEIAALYPAGDARILVGCAPCQPFSRYTNRSGEDGKWRLVARFADLVAQVLPEVLSMENVPELSKHKVFSDFVSVLNKAGYHVSHSIVDCVAYGIPQTRHRLVLFASLLGDIEIARATHPPSRRRTVRQKIGSLQRIGAGQASARDPIHRASSLSPLNLTRIRATPPRGGWRDWPGDLRLKCHKAESGRSYPSVYGRIAWDDPGPTITTQCNGLGNGRFGHPEQDRALSIREAALLQTFPKYYRLLRPGSALIMKTAARHIGNAVPVRLGRIIARSIRNHLQAHCSNATSARGGY